MPIAAMAPALIGGGMSLVQGLLGGGKNKSNQSATQNIDKTTTNHSTQQQQFDQGTQYDEDPLMQLGRLMLMGQYGNAFSKASEPLYGNEAKASILHNTNELTSSAINKLKQTMAGAGGFNSGAHEAGAADIFRGGNATAIQALMQLPMLNKKAYNESMNPLLGMASSWLGRAPVNSRSFGTANGTTDSTSTEKGTVANTGMGTAQGPSGWGAGLGNLLGFGGGVLGDYLGGQGGKWGLPNNVNKGVKDSNWWNNNGG